MLRHSTRSIGLTLACATLLGLGLVACDSKQRGEQQTPATTDEKGAEQTGQTTAKDDEELAAPEKSDLAKYTADVAGDGPLQAVIVTSEGEIRCDLHADRAQLTVTNFVGLALGKKAWRDPETGDIVKGKPYYDGVEFHRVIPNFMIQAGDRSGKGTEGPGYTIPDEFHPELSHDKAGVLSMANRGEPDSGGAQWFILEMPAPHLDERHSVFGQCDNLDVVEKISRTPTGPENRPQDPPTIENIEIERAAREAPAPTKLDSAPESSSGGAPPE